VSHLDRNLAELLRRYEPVALDADFRERLGERVRDEALRLAAERRAERAPRLVRTPWIPALAAAASLLAVLLAGWWMWRAGPEASGLDQLVAQWGAAQRSAPVGEWQPLGPDAPALQAGYLEVASGGGAAVRIELPQLGSVELPAGVRDDGVIAGHVVLERSAGGPTRVRMLRGDSLAHLAAGDRLLPEGCDLVLDGGQPRFGAEGQPEASLPVAPDGEPRPLEAGVPAAPEPLPLGPREISGRVTRAPDGEPLPKFRLILVQSDVTAQGPRQVVHEVEDADGRFRWSKLPLGRFHLYVQAEGLAPSITRHVSIDETLVLPPLEIELVPGRKLRGRVVHGETGAPVAGAIVVSQTDAPAIMLGYTAEALEGQHLPQTTTDEEGRFELARLRPELQVLQATFPGRAPGLVEVPADADETELRMPEPGSIIGDVRRDDGSPWPNVIIIASFTNPLPSARCMNYGFGITDAEGHYRIDDLPAQEGMLLNLGEVDAVVRMPAMEAITVQAGRTLRVDFGPRVPPADTGTLVGILTEADGKPAAGRMISVLGSTWERTGHFETSMVNADGEWRVERLPADTYDIYAVFDATDGTVTLAGRVNLPAGGETHVSLQLSGGAITGRVLAPDGTPLGRSDVIVERREATGTWEFASHAVADEAGTWRCQSLAAGLYRATCFDRTGRYGAARGEPVIVGSEEIAGHDIHLGLGGDLLVRVTGPDGAPVEGAAIQLRDARGATWDFAQWQATGPGGSFKFSAIPIGMWDVEAALEGGPAGRTSVEVRSGEAAVASIVLPAN
jgi:hypothetical protein